MEDLVQIVARFHREVVAPDIEPIVGQAELRLRGEVQAGFDASIQRLDRLQTE